MNKHGKIKLAGRKFVSLSQKQKHIIFTVIIIILGISALLLLKFLKRPLKQVKPQITAPLVSVEKINAKDMSMMVSGFGTVQAKVNVEIVPQVAGNVVKINPNFKPGGFIAANETIVLIDPQDYELQVRQAKAAVAQAEVQLEIEQSEAKVAKAEWYQLNPGIEPTSPLVLREPQVKQAQSNLESAKAKLATAQLNLDRTNVVMPIDICIERENIDLGQFANAGQPIGSAFGIETAEVELPLEDRDLAWFNIPSNPISYNGDKASKAGSDAIVETNFAGKKHQWQGKVTRTTGTVDEKTRLVSVVIEIDQPFHSEDKPALLPGTFVDVSIIGKNLEHVFKVPRDAVHNQNQVWVAKDGKLYIKELDIIRAEKEYVYVLSGLEDGCYIVTSPMDAITDGMDIRYQVPQEMELDKPVAINDANSTEQQK